MSFLQDLYNGKANLGTNPLSGMFGGNMFLKNYNMPNGGGSYSTAGTAPVTPVVPAYVGNQNVPNAPVKPTPVFTGGAPVAPVAPVRSKYIDPATGQYFKTAQDYANYVASKIPASKNMGDAINYSQGAINNPDQSSADLTTSARNLNNARNDLAVGDTSMFQGMDKNASGEKIIYSPTEQEAIRKAAAGIYDPILNDVFTKLEAKQKSETLKASQDFELTKLQKQHEYTMAEKGLTGGGSGIYVPGENPQVDDMAENIMNGKATLTNVPAAYKMMVSSAMKNYGNQANGKPTTTELGLAALANAKALMDKFNAGTGTSAVGKSRLLGYGAFPPPGTDAADFTNDFNAIKSQLSLEAVKFLKGQGQVSDAERALLAQAATKLNLTQSEDEFKKTLQGIIDKLEGNAVTNTGGAGSKPQTMVLNGVTLQLQADGTYE